MCTIVLLRRPGDGWPLMLAANRDEMLTRAALPPGRHWPDQPEVIAGQDLEAGGTWLGLNDRGLVAAISNRRGSLGPAPGMRSRGALPLKALAHDSAVRAAADLAELDVGLYRPFNLVIADCRDAFWLCNREGDDAIDCTAIPTGLSMLTAAELDDRTSDVFDLDEAVAEAEKLVPFVVALANDLLDQNLLRKRLVVVQRAEHPAIEEVIHPQQLRLGTHEGLVGSAGEEHREAPLLQRFKQAASAGHDHLVGLGLT